MAATTSYVSLPVTCEVCRVSVDSAKTWVQHVSSKAHHKKIRKTHPNETEVRRFVYVTGVEVAPEELALRFLECGKVVDVEKVVRQSKPTFYFVEFDDVVSAQKALRARVFFHGQEARVQPRKADVREANTIDTSRIRDALMTGECCGEQCDALIEAIEMTESELGDRENFRRNLESWIRFNVRPGADVYTFGSCLTKLGLRGTDIDVFVDFKFQPGEEKLTQGEMVKRVARNIRRLQGIVNVRSIVHARVPIVKLFCKTIGVDVDLSFRNSMSVKNSELIAVYVNGDPRIRSVLMVLRYWARTFSVTTVHGRTGGPRGGSGGGFSNYAFTWLVLHALMNLPEDEALPTVLQLQAGCAEDEIEGWNCGFNRIWSQSNRARMTEFEMMRAFFKYYAHFDFGLFVVSPLTGRAIPRVEFAHPELLGAEFARYRAAWLTRRDMLQMKSPVFIQDPFELSFNVARSVSRSGCRSFSTKCEEAFEVCRLWEDEPEGRGSLYPMIYLALGEVEARKLCSGYYDVPFPLRKNPPSVPGLIRLDVADSSLAHAFPKRDDRMGTTEEHVQFWQETVAQYVWKALAEGLFYDVWNVGDLDATSDELARFMPSFIEMYDEWERQEEEIWRKYEEWRNVKAARECLERDLRDTVSASQGSPQQDAIPQKKRPNPDFIQTQVITNRNLVLSDAIIHHIASQVPPEVLDALPPEQRECEIRHLKIEKVETPSAYSACGVANVTELRRQLAQLRARERKLQAQLGLWNGLWPVEWAEKRNAGCKRGRNRAPNDQSQPPPERDGLSNGLPEADVLSVLGPAYHGPLELRQNRADWMLKKLNAKLREHGNPEVLASYFVEVRHPALFRKGMAKPPRVNGPLPGRLVTEKFRTANMLYKSCNPPGFDGISTHPLRQLAVAVAKQTYPAGVTILLVEESAVNRVPDGTPTSFLTSRNENSLGSFIETLVLALLQEADEFAIGHDDTGNEDVVLDEGRDAPGGDDVN